MGSTKLMPQFMWNSVSLVLLWCRIFPYSFQVNQAAIEVGKPHLFFFAGRVYLRVHIAFDGEPGSPSATTAEELYLHLAAHGVMTLLDDRFEKPKNRAFDLEIMRLPIRIWLTDESVSEEKAEVRFPDAEPQTVDLADAAHMVLAAFAEDHGEDEE